MLARQMLRDYGFIAAGYLLVLTGTLVPAILFWPDFRENMPGIAKMIPIEALSDFFEAIDEFGYYAYFTVQQFFKGANMFGLAAGAILGTGMIAREADNRTAEFLLSRPVTRRRILLVRWSIGALMLSVPIFISSLVGMAVSKQVDETLPLGPVLAASLYLSLFQMVLYTATVWLSARSEHQMRPAIIIIAFGLLQLALYLVKSVGDYSIFRLVDVQVMLSFQSGEFPWLRAGGMVLLTSLLLGMALRSFERRDF